MGGGGGRALRRHGGIDDDAGAPGGQAREPHGQPGRMAVLDAGGGERVIQPPFDPASAAMEPGEAAVGMSQGAQGRGDAPDRRQMRIGEGAGAVGQGGLGPGEQGEDLQQFLGVAGGDAALRVDFGRAFPFQRLLRRADTVGEAVERETGVDQAAERLEPRQAGAGAFPAAVEELGLVSERLEIGVLCGFLLTAQQEIGVVDPADHAAAREVRCPARPGAVAVARDPVPEPGLRLVSGRSVGDCGQVVEPAEAVQFRLERGGGRGQRPDVATLILHQIAREHEVPGEQLAALGKAADAARFGLGHETARRTGPGRRAGIDPVKEPGPGCGAGRVFGHPACRSLSGASPGGP